MPFMHMLPDPGMNYTFNRPLLDGTSPARLKEVADWVERYRRFWEQSFDRLDDYLRKLQTKEKKHGRKQRKS